MKTGYIPFKFDLNDIIGLARRLVAGRLGDVTLNLPLVSIAISPRDRERQVAREIALRLRERRVPSALECCDGCVNNALTSQGNSAVHRR